ncbi:MAG: hypothetical protein ABI578_06855 [Chloroflexota bacterium]
MGTTIRVIAVLALVGLTAVVGTNVYNAGVSAGLAEAANHVVASGAAPAYVYPGAYIGHPWGLGFGFFGFFFLIFGFFLVMGLLRAAFGRGRWGGHGQWKSRGGPREYMDEWHRHAHGETPTSDQPS